MGEIAHFRCRLIGEYPARFLAWPEGGAFSTNRPGWVPAMNAYLCEKTLTVCVDLAGIEASAVELQVEPRRLQVRGERAAPEPCEEHARVQQILLMEIDHGPFCRALELPVEVEPTGARAEQRNGMLWVQLPLRCQG